MRMSSQTAMALYLPNVGNQPKEQRIQGLLTSDPQLFSALRAQNDGSISISGIKWKNHYCTALECIAMPWLTRHSIRPFIRSFSHSFIQPSIHPSGSD